MWWMVAAAAVSAVAQGAAASKAAKEQAQDQGNSATYEGTLNRLVKRQEADDELKFAQEKAAKILSAANYLRASQTAQAVGSGVIVGEGSAQVMQDRTNELAMSDSLAALYSGGRAAASLRAGGDFAQRQAEQRISAAERQAASSQKAAMWKMGGSLLSAAGSAYSQYQGGTLGIGEYGSRNLPK